MDDIFSIVTILTLLFAFIFLFIRISLWVRKSGGSMMTTMSGATDAFYNAEKKHAIEIIVEQKAGKKMNEQTSGEPEEKL